MATIVPTITAENPHQYREQIERVQGFAKRLHIDLMDGEFTPNKGVDIAQVWLPDDIICDIHLMYKNPEEATKALIALEPHLIIIPAESDCDFEALASIVHSAGVKFGVALLAETEVNKAEAAIVLADHVLLFSGNLGHQGGSTADLNLLSKVAEIKAINPTAEIGWDGGVNAENIKQIADADVDVINTGGAIHFADNPQAAYQELEQAVA